MSDWYRRDGSGPITYDEMGDLQWGAKAPVAVDRLTSGITVSTVFLSLDHGWGDNHVPLIFETMVFGGRWDQSQERYATEADALAGHRRWVEKAADPQPTGRVELAGLIERCEHAYTDNALALAEHLLAAGMRLIHPLDEQS